MSHAFATIRDSLPEKSNSEEYCEEMDAYMDSVVDHRLYSEIDSKEFVQKAISSKNVFRSAIGFEKDSDSIFHGIFTIFIRIRSEDRRRSDRTGKGSHSKTCKHAETNA